MCVKNKHSRAHGTEAEPDQRHINLHVHVGMDLVACLFFRTRPAMRPIHVGLQCVCITRVQQL